MPPKRFAAQQLIVRCCFPLVAAAYAQHKLQIWYFWFQIVFVVLVTSIGPSVVPAPAALEHNTLNVRQSLHSMHSEFQSL